jgi:uncharacterized protein
MKRIGLWLPLLVLTAFLLLEVAVRQALLLLVGVGLGVALAKARFGFTTGWRLLLEQRDPQGVAAQLLLLALTSLVALPLLESFGELQAALGAPGVAMLLGAFVFGLAMQLADGCGSGTLYKAGLGLPYNVLVFPLFALGSFVGSLHLPYWQSLGQIEPVSLIQVAGVSGALAMTALGLLLLALAVRLWVGPGKIWWQRRWVVGAIFLAIFATLNLLIAGQPWGVVYGFGLWAAKLAQGLGVWDPSTSVFWAQAAHAQRLHETVLLDVTTITNLGILWGALWVGWREKTQGTAQAPDALSRRQIAVGIVAGFVLGYSSRLALGCNVGAMLSGISTGSLHGWLWVPLALAGSVVGIRWRRALFEPASGQQGAAA